MKRSVKFNSTTPLFIFLLVLGIIAGYAWAETIELVTYYPTSSNTGDMHTTSLTVGNAYLNTTLANGQALIQTSLGIGPGFGNNAPTNPLTLLEVQGVAGQASQALFLPGADGTISVGIGVPAPSQQLEISGNFRLPATTAAGGVATGGIIYSGANRFIHNFGTNNFFAGVNAGNLTLTGNRLTGVGGGVLNQNTSGIENTGLGNDSLTNNRGGSRNTAVGTAAISGNTAGSDNTAVGAGTFGFNSTGSRNTAIGFGAGTFVTAGVPANGNATGSNNTFLGFQAGPGADMTLNNATAIGSNALVSANNALVLGGTGANAVNVGIGVAAPSASALLDLTSTSRGFLPPRMIMAQRNAILAPAAGLTIYNTSTNQINTFNGLIWTVIAPPGASVFAANGYSQLPGGLIIQWGTTGVSNFNVQTHNFPIAFPTACLQVVATPGLNGDAGSVNIIVGNFTTTSFQSDGGTAERPFHWIAVGN